MPIVKYNVRVNIILLILLEAISFRVAAPIKYRTGKSGGYI
jgi:hypothetical protein